LNHPVVRNDFVILYRINRADHKELHSQNKTDKYTNVTIIFVTHSFFWAGIAQSVQQLATGWTVRGSNPGGGRFSAPVQTGPGAHPASYIMGTGFFPGVKRPGRGIDYTPPSSAEVEGRV